LIHFYKSCEPELVRTLLTEMQGCWKESLVREEDNL